MTTPILQLKSLGIDDLMKFEWVSAPPAEIVLRALEGLVSAGMIGEDGRLTTIGKDVAECPVEVGIARMVTCLDFRTVPAKSYIQTAVQLQRAQVWGRNSHHCCNDFNSGKISKFIPTS